MPRPLVIPFFISHQGCPHLCSFCDQHAITGTGRDPGLRLGGAEVSAGIEEALARPRHPGRQGVQVAFYGGSFTGLPLERQTELLEAVRPFLAGGEVDGVRLSTRPDYVKEGTIPFLRTYGVTTVELGIQSLNDRVLAACGRGHSAEDSERAIRMLREGGMTVGVQLMVGLPGESTSSLLAGARRLAGLQPDLARIYPVVVLKGSRLEKEMAAGAYRPLCLEKAVALSGAVRESLERAGIRVIRVGLQDTDSLKASIIAGPFHPAFGEMVLARNLFRRAVSALRAREGSPPRTMLLAAADQSVFRGVGSRNLQRLRSRGLLDGVEVVFDPELPRGTVEVKSKKLKV